MTKLYKFKFGKLNNYWNGSTALRKDIFFNIQMLNYQFMCIILNPNFIQLKLKS